MSDNIKFKCDSCGKEFDADPDTMVEVHMGGSCPCCDEKISKAEADRLIESGEAISAERLERMTEYELQEIGLTPQERDALLRGEQITTGGACICKECQDRMAGEQPA